MLRKKILLTNDYDVLTELQESFLHLAGFKLLVAENCQRIFQLVEEEHPDVVILPDDQPVGDVSVCCYKLKSDPFLKAIPLILVVGSMDEQKGCKADRTIPRASIPFQLLDAIYAVLDIKPRTKERFRVHFESALCGTDDFAAVGNTRNISIGGLYVETSELLPVNRTLTVKFSIPGRGKAIECRARIAWVNHPEWVKKGDLPPGMGLEFLEMSGEDHAFLKEYIQNRCDDPFY